MNGSSLPIVVNTAGALNSDGQNGQYVNTYEQFDNVSFETNSGYREPVATGAQKAVAGRVEGHEALLLDDPDFANHPGNTSLPNLSLTPSDGVFLRQLSNSVQLQPLGTKSTPTSNRGQQQHHNNTQHHPSQNQFPTLDDPLSQSQLQLQPPPHESGIRLLYVDIMTPMGHQILTTYLKIKATYSHYHNLKQRRLHPFYAVSLSYIATLFVFAAVLTVFVAMAVFNRLEITRDSFTIQLIFSCLAFLSSILIMPTFSSFPRQYTIWQKTVWTALPYLSSWVIYPSFLVSHSLPGVCFPKSHRGLKPLGLPPRIYSPS